MTSAAARRPTKNCRKPYISGGRTRPDAADHPDFRHGRPAWHAGTDRAADAPGSVPLRQPAVLETVRGGRVQMPAVQETVEQVRSIDVDLYKYGFTTDVEMEKAPRGLSEDVIRYISAQKNEPDWMLEWRLDAYRRWLTMREPNWARVDYERIDYDGIYYYAAPKKNPAPKSLDEVDPEILKTYEKLGIPLREQEILAGVEPQRRVAVDAVFDSVSVATTFKEELKKAGVIVMPISEASREHPDLVRRYLGSVVPVTDNFFATLNAAVFSDGSRVAKKLSVTGTT